MSASLAGGGGGGEEEEEEEGSCWVSDEEDGRIDCRENLATR